MAGSGFRLPDLRGRAIDGEIPQYVALLQEWNAATVVPVPFIAASAGSALNAASACLMGNNYIRWCAPVHDAREPV